MPHEIWLPAESSVASKAKQHALVHLISGNPGCIGYYDDFLRSLRTLLDPVERDTVFDLYGKDLGGFSEDDHAQPFSVQNPPYVLEAQIRLVFDDVASRRIQENSPNRRGNPYDFVVLMGHSVGAYMALEIFHRHMKDPSTAPHLVLRHGFLLFPTVTHIAHSPSGQRLDFVRLRPWLGNITQAAVFGFLSLWRQETLQWIVQNVLGFSPKAAEVTAKFLKSRDAVYQALSMGKDEMTVIGEDKWEDELWEVSGEAEAHRLEVPKFYFFFGKNDHWVSDKFREAFIKTRTSHGKGKVSIAIDEGNIQHAFCTKEHTSVLVAETVKSWISEILKTTTPE
jgi:pimeloyl-ACP methyl ester carboxylesterase